MVEVQIGRNQLDRANARLNRFHFDAGVGLSKFGSEKERTLFGYLGEQVVADFLNLEQSSETFEYDLVFRGKRLEVKTVSCKFKPLPSYLCTVNSHDLSGVHKQGADFYVFVRIINDRSKGWILGYMPCAEFFEKGQFVAKGSEVIKGVSFQKANATVLAISNLRPIQSIFSI
jgi:hypothetical protein